MEININLLKSEFVKKGMTQEEVAREMGISSQTLSRKLNRKRDFRLGELYSLCKILGIEDPKKIFFAISIPDMQRKEKPA